MVCSICGENDSMLSISVQYNGRETTVHICKDCINKFGLDTSNIDNLIKDIMELIRKNIVKNLEITSEEQNENQEFEEELLSFDNIISMISSNNKQPIQDENKSVTRSSDMKKTESICPYCGSSIEEVIGNQNLGCINCIEFFGTKIKHKPAKFEGRVPRVYRSIYINEKFKDYLSSKMMIEVVRENFEKASKIRTIISKIVK
ncbi:MAG: hypothetical protein RMJ37_04040 [Spirochaetia bacterium]|nr:hypothetical protein [Spirochaetota bacterium]MCX8096666.1 hypothetical protein [Spirochaetota bacterium]MDW8112497.1 hypothetical protein [Spirochaetia bacterium]